MQRSKVAVIGAGLSGLCVARHAKESGHQTVVFEQTSNIGGTWVYTDAIGTDEFGLKIHTSMYHNLRTNIPKEIMEFRDFPMQPLSQSYITSDQFLTYLISYAEHFDLVKLIKFKNCVTCLCPIDGNKWKVKVKDLPTNEMKTYIFDAVFVCNGHFSDPNLPTFEGIDQFEGSQVHSHDYRKASAYKDKNVLVIGAGPSGIDLVYAISKTASKVIFSHHTHNDKHVFASNVIKKGRIKRFIGNGVIFADDSEESVTDILFCTGYNHCQPFMCLSCDINIENNCLTPLYKHCINIQHPTMYIIGILFSAAITQIIDMQVRFCMHYLNGDGELPTKDEMLADMERDLNRRWALGWPKKKAHSVSDSFHREYFRDLEKTANIESVRNVIFKIYEDSGERRHNHPNEYRNDIYTIIDDEQFERHTLTG